MRYLGRIAGNGLLTRDGETVARASYDFDGFIGSGRSVTSSGEIKVSPSDLMTVFGQLGVQLLTDDGRHLGLRFSDSEPRRASDVAHVDVTGDLPSSPAKWRSGSRPEPNSVAGRSPSAASSRTGKPASISGRPRRGSP
jgi:hypothetical protein